MSLTAKQQLFVDEYLKCRNAAEAARRAGYAEGSARVTGHRLLTNANISDEIARRTEEGAMGVPELLSRLADESRGTMEDFVSFNEAPYPDFTLDLDKARRRNKLHLIRELSYDQHGNPKIKLYSALEAKKALVQLLTSGPRGSGDDPQHTVQWTVEEWQAEQEKRRQEAAETMEMFDE